MAKAWSAESCAYPLAALVKVEAELARWRSLRARPRLWWRDDDVRTPSPALDRLLTLAAGRPLALAVIPDGALEDLAKRIGREKNVSIGQHGVDHTNRRPPGQTPSEYPSPPSAEQVSARILVARDRLLDAGLKPSFYTPPWNAVDPHLSKAVLRAGIPVLSAGAETPVYADLLSLPAEVDVLRWKGPPRFKGALRVMSALNRALAARRLSGDLARPVGLLTHHLDHDAETWRFLDWAVGYFDARFDWVSVESPVRRCIAAADTRGETIMAAMAQAGRV